MKKIILISLTFILFGCEEPKQVYETSIKTYVISSKIEDHGTLPGYHLYFHSLTSTERAEVNYDTYIKYQIGDTIQVLIKYWEKPKRTKKIK